MSESEIGYQPEEASVEKSFNLESIIAELGVTETEEMAHVRSLCVEAIIAENEQERISLYNDYCDQLEEMITLSHTTTQAQIAGDLLVAKIFHEAGDTGRYLEELTNAQVYADNMGYSDLNTQLLAEIKAYQ